MSYTILEMTSFLPVDKRKKDFFQFHMFVNFSYPSNPTHKVFFTLTSVEKILRMSQQYWKVIKKI